MSIHDGEPPTLEPTTDASDAFHRFLHDAHADCSASDVARLKLLCLDLLLYTTGSVEPWIVAGKNHEFYTAVPSPHRLVFRVTILIAGVTFLIW